MAVREAIRSLDPTARADEFCAVLGETHRALMRNILTWESDGVWARDGLPDLGRWIALRFDITLYRARRWIACAHKLEELPLTSLAVERGELGLDKAVELTRFATPEDEARLLRWARRNTVTDIRLRADEAVAAPRDEVQQAELSRHLGYGWSPDRLNMHVYATFPAYEGTLVKATIDELAATLEPTPADLTAAIDTDDTIGMRRADAAFKLLTGGGTEEQGVASTVVVHAELDVVKGTRSGATDDGLVLHPDVVKQICCDARLQTVIEDGGTALGIGYESRQVPRWLARQVKRRDRHCVFPGCVEHRFLQNHHVTPWPQGPTELTNLVSLCWRHHKLIHLFGWRVSLGPRGSIEWYRPDGRKLEPGPAPPT